MGKSSRLYEIRDDIANLLDGAVDPETGEIAEGASEQLAALHIERDELLSALTRAYKNVRAEGDMYSREYKRLQSQARARENTAAWLKSVIADHVPAGAKWKRDVASIYYTTSTRTVVDGELPDDCYKPREPMLSEVKRRIEAGEEIAAHLEPSQSIVIR